jgi:hypothetical protein
MNTRTRYNDEAEHELDYRCSLLEENESEPEIIPLYPQEG